MLQSAMQQLENIFLRCMKAWAPLLFPNLQLMKCDNNLKIGCSFKSMPRQLIAGLKQCNVGFTLIMLVLNAVQNLVYLWTCYE